MITSMMTMGHHGRLKRDRRSDQSDAQKEGQTVKNHYYCGFGLLYILLVQWIFVDVLLGTDATV